MPVIGSLFGFEYQNGVFVRVIATDAYAFGITQSSFGKAFAIQFQTVNFSAFATLMILIFHFSRRRQVSKSILILLKLILLKKRVFLK
jgi:hypothetical protein